MTELLIQPTATAQWHDLVTTASHAAGISLTEDLESYLVFLLMRFTVEPQLASSVLAMEYLQGQQYGGAKRHDLLRNLGDKCLLFAGLFPGRAARKRVQISYFVRLGRSAYGSLSEIHQQRQAQLYITLCHEFVHLMDVLLSLARATDRQDILTPLQALELWDETQSQTAYQMLLDLTTAGTPQFPGSRLKH